MDTLTKIVTSDTMSLAEKRTLLAGVLLIFLSFLAVLSFASVSTISLVTRHISHYWNVCFLLCSLALGGWMIFYAGQLRLGGGVMIFRNNVLLFWLLIITVLVSAILRFASPQKYIAILVLALSLVVFHVAVPGFLNAIWLIRKR
jgi:hypothetical protein